MNDTATLVEIDITKSKLLNKSDDSKMLSDIAEKHEIATLGVNIKLSDRYKVDNTKYPDFNLRLIRDAIGVVLLDEWATNLEEKDYIKIITTDMSVLRDLTFFTDIRFWANMSKVAIT